MLNTERLDYLLNTVVPHLETMTTVDKWRLEGMEYGCAILDFDQYVDASQSTGKPVSKKYDCGMRGCFAGWYRMLAEEDGLIESHHLQSFSLQDLSDHFGLEFNQSIKLFTGLSGGIEGDLTYEDERTTKALKARKIYLQELMQEATEAQPA